MERQKRLWVNNMAHVLVLRSSVSFVQASENTVYGTHEKIEMAINSRRYKYDSPSNPRSGYNIPHSCEWHFMEYRIKKECIQEFLRDLGGQVLNPVNNKSSIWKILRIKSNCETNTQISKSLMLIQYIFKWINRVNKIIKVCPIKPVPDIAQGTPQPFTTGWHYDFIIGILPDIETEQGEEL